MMASSDDNPLWQYVCALYDKQGVKDECLVFQDQQGGNINLLLMCCWLGRQGISLDDAMLAELLDLMAYWDKQVITPIRDIRKQSGLQKFPEFYQQVKSLELSGERELHNVFYHWAVDQHSSINLKPQAKYNVEYYLASLGLAPTGFVNLLSNA